MVTLMNGFLTYLLLMIIIVAVAAVAVFVALRLRKKNDAKKLAEKEINS